MEKKQLPFIAPGELSPGLHRLRVEGTEVQPSRVNVIFTVLGPDDLQYLNHQTMARFNTEGAGSLHATDTLLQLVSVASGKTYVDLDDHVLRMLHEKVLQGKQVTANIVETPSGWTEFHFPADSREENGDALFVELTKLWNKLDTSARIVVLAKANELASSR